MNEQSREPILHHAIMLLQQGRFAEAEGRLRELLSGNPEDAQALYLLAVAQHRQDGGDARALITIRDALARDPNDASAHALHASVLLALERRSEAREAAKTAIAMDPHDTSGHTALATVHMDANEWADAERCARAALEIDPEDSTASNLLATALRLQGRSEANAEQLAGMLARDPEDAFTHANAGWQALQSGDRAKAEEHFREALRLDPDNEYARNGLLTAFKAKSPLYRLHLAFSLWMARFTSGRQWMILIGLILVVRFARRLIGTPLAPLGYVIIYGYLLFAVWQHIADGVGHLLILASRYRIVLRPAERFDGLLCGGSLVVGLAGVVTGLLLGIAPAFHLGLALTAAAVPFAHVCLNVRQLGRLLFAFFGVFIVATGVALAWADVTDSDAVWLGPLISTSMLMWIGTTWIANIPALKRRA